MSKSFKLFLVLIFILGCRETKEVKRDEPPNKPIPIKKEPVITFKIASIQLSEKVTKYSQKSIAELSNKLKNENIDILIVKSVTRYPELKDRTDLVKELSKETDMKYQFFEIENNSGRQFGDAIFSVFPFVANNNSINKFFFANSTIDVGISNLNVSILNSNFNINKHIKDLESSLNTYNQIVVGNLERDKDLLTNNSILNLYSGVFITRKTEELKLHNNYILELQLGKIVICEFGIFKNIVVD